MKLEKEFVVPRTRAAVAKIFDEDATYAQLFPDTRLVSSKAGARETSTSYSALGQSRDIRFVFKTQPDGNVRFEKVCDGRVWRQLDGSLSFAACGKGATLVRIEMEGRTKALVPEFTIKGPMQEQIEQMADALRRCIEGASAR